MNTKRVENEYGLTFAEWLAAAGGRAHVEAVMAFNMTPLIAWRGGEDPTEYRAADAARILAFKEDNRARASKATLEDGWNDWVAFRLFHRGDGRPRESSRQYMRGWKGAQEAARSGIPLQSIGSPAYYAALKDLRSAGLVKNHAGSRARKDASGGARPRHDDRSVDERYTFTREFTGHPSGKPQYVARFVGDWIGSGSSLKEAHTIATSHQRSRWSDHNRADGEERVTRSDFRPRTRKGYYKSGVNVVRIEDVLPHRSAPGAKLGVADWWVYGTMSLATPDRDGPSQGGQSATLQMKLYEFTSGNWKRIDASKLSPKWRAFFARNPDGGSLNRADGAKKTGKSQLSPATRVTTLAQLGVSYDPSLFYSVKGGKLYARARTGGGGYGRGRLGKATLLGSIPGFKKNLFYSVKGGVVSARRRK